MEVKSLAELPVLDHGIVQLLDMMPRQDVDMEPVRAARISYGEFSKGREADEKLLSYLILHEHDSTLEHIIFKFRVEAPVVVWWQWVRHRLASYNFQSGRYTEVADKFYIPDVDQWRKQSKSNKQGSSGYVSSTNNPDRTLSDAEAVVGDELTDMLTEQIIESVERYRYALRQDVAKEQARLFLPAWCLYYQAYVTVNARSLINFLKLRLDEHAQWEIRQYAQAILTILRPVMPLILEHYFGTENEVGEQ